MTTPRSNQTMLHKFFISSTFLMFCNEANLFEMRIQLNAVVLSSIDVVMFAKQVIHDG